MEALLESLNLSALRFLEENNLIIAFASDGKDNTDAVGAFANALTKEKARKLGLDMEQYLREKILTNFSKKTGDFIKTGPTGVKVSDFIVTIKN